MSLMKIGGTSKHDVFRAKTDGADITLVQDDGSTAITLNSQKLIRVKYTEESNPAPREDRGLNLSLKNKEDDVDIQAFLNEYAYQAVSSAPQAPDWYDEEGVKYSAASADSSIKLVTISAYGLSDDGTKRKAVVNFCKCKNTSGGFASKAGTWSDPSLEFEGVVPDKKVVIDKEAFDPLLFTVAADVEILAGTSFAILWLPKQT